MQLQEELSVVETANEQTGGLTGNQLVLYHNTTHWANKGTLSQ